MTFHRSLLFLLLTIVFSSHSFAAATPVGVNTEDHTGILHKPSTLDRATVESQLGRKLKFKERIALSILNAKIRHAEKKGHPIQPGDFQATTEGFAIAGFVVGIVSILLVNPILAILAIVFSSVSLGKIRKFEGLYKGRGLAIAGLVMGIVSIVFVLFVLALALAFFWV